MTNKMIKIIAIAILIGISFLAVSAQEQILVSVNETSNSTEKAEKKEPVKKQSTSDEDSWTGFYVGGFGGYTNGRANPKTSTADITNSSYTQATIDIINRTGNQRIKSNGINGGGTVGYNFQKGNFVVGGELDFGTNRINQTFSGSGNYQSGRSFTITQSVKSNWMMTARQRVGVASKKVLVYATGGLAFTNIKYAGDLRDAANWTESGSFSKNKSGWVAGGGVEFKVSHRLSVKSEYLFSQFGGNSITSNNFTIIFLGPAPGTNVFTHSTDLKSHNIRFGVNYRF